MSKPYRDTSDGAGLDVVVPLPAPVVERIEQAARERGETVAGWCRAELVAAVEGEGPRGLASVPREELVFDVRMAFNAFAGRRLTESLGRDLARRVAEHLERYQVRCFRLAPLRAPSTHSLPREELERRARGPD